MASSIETTSTTTTLKNNGNTYATVDTNDDVTITNDLAVSGTLNTTGVFVHNDAGAAVDFRVEGDTKPFLLFASGTEDKVGINTAGVIAQLTVEKTDSEGNIAISSTQASDNGDLGEFQFWNRTNAGSGSGTSFVNDVAAIKGQMEGTGNNSGGSLHFYTKPDGETKTEKMTIDGVGNVGIGTNAPALPLEVECTARGIATSGTTPIGALRIGSPDNNIVLDTGITTGNYCYIQGTDKANLATGTNLLINPNGGNVGIGTTAPAQKLTTVGTASAGVLTPSLMVANSLASNDSVAGMVFHNRYDVNSTGFKAAIILDGDNNSDATGDLKFLNSNEANIANPATIASHTRLVITKAGDLKFNSGYGSAATAYGCRAWVNFNGTGTVAIREDGNVSSITDLGTGYYRVNFAVAMPDVNYAVIGMSQYLNNVGLTVMDGPSDAATGNFTVSTKGTAGSGADVKFDSAFVSVAVFR